MLSLAQGKPFEASLLWLRDSEAITSAQMQALERISRHRHDLTHELDRYLVDPEHEPDVDLLVEALEILRSISRFWTQIEIDIGILEEHGEVTVDEVMPSQLAFLQTCIGAYVGVLASDFVGQPTVDRR